MPTEKRQRKREGQRARQAAALAAARRAARRRTMVTTGLIAVIGLIVMGVAFGLPGGDKDEKKVTTTNQEDDPTVQPKKTGAETACPNPDGSSPRTMSFSGPPPMCIDTDKRYTAEMKTTKGTMTIALDAKKAPNTVNNFVVLSRYHYYDGVKFHRIIPGFVVQGGDPQGTGTGGPGYKFKDELPKAGEYEIGSLAMANSGPNTNGSQFFIITGPQGASLPPSYSLFGKITEGLDVAKALEAVGTPGDGKPTEEVKIESVTITEQ